MANYLHFILNPYSLIALTYFLPLFLYDLRMTKASALRKVTILVKFHLFEFIFGSKYFTIIFIDFYLLMNLMMPISQ